MKPISFTSKKGQLQTLAPSVIAIVIAAVFLILGIVMLVEFRDTDILREAHTSTITNESVSTVDEIGTALGGTVQPAAHGFSLSGAINGTTGAIVESTNITITDAGLITITGGDVNNGTNLNVTYSFQHGGEAFLSANDTMIATANFSDFWEIIVLAVVISIVIGLLLVTFGTRKTR